MGRDFLQLVSVPRPDGEGGEGDEVLVEYDVEWLSIVKSTHHLLSNTRGQVMHSTSQCDVISIVYDTIFGYILFEDVGQACPRVRGTSNHSWGSLP